MEFAILPKYFIFDNAFYSNSLVLCPKMVLLLDFIVWGGNLYKYSTLLPYSW